MISFLVKRERQKTQCAMVKNWICFQSLYKCFLVLCDWSLTIVFVEVIFQRKSNWPSSIWMWWILMHKFIFTLWHIYTRWWCVTHFFECTNLWCITRNSLMFSEDFQVQVDMSFDKKLHPWVEVLIILSSFDWRVFTLKGR